jgi:hypothetical protein
LPVFFKEFWFQLLLQGEGEWLMNSEVFNMPAIAYSLSCHPDEGGIYLEYPDDILHPHL